MILQAGGMRIPKILALLLVLIAAIALIPSLGTAQKPAKKLSKQDVMDLLTGDVPSSQVALEARKAGISFPVTASAEKEIRAAGGTDDLIRVLRSLAPRAPASPSATPHPGHATSPPILSIESNPGQTQVYIDDEPIGSTSQEGRLKLTRLSEGDHRVRISLSGYQDYEETITLTGGQTTTVVATLQPPPPPPQRPQTVETPTANTGQPGYLGVQAMQPQPAGARGVVISGAYPGTPAEQAGLKAYDTILAVNGRQVATLQNVHDALLGRQAGESVAVTWYNGSRNVTQQIRLVDASAAASQVQTQPPSLTNMPHNGFVTFTVAHDHGPNGQGGNNYCVGVMSIGNGVISYTGTKSTLGLPHTFQIPLNSIKEAKRNGFYLVAIGGFHIRLRMGTVYNFVAIDNQGHYQPPDPVLTAIETAMGK